MQGVVRGCCIAHAVVLVVHVTVLLLGAEQEQVIRFMCHTAISIFDPDDRITADDQLISAGEAAATCIVLVYIMEK